MILKGTKLLLVLLLVVTSLINSFSILANAKIKLTKEKGVEGILPTCTTVGELKCPTGFKPSCPEQHKPSCIFAGTKQLPACLADSSDNTFFSYKLDKISCKKIK
ncbi:MAG: hypothetical protein A3B68_02245 [Candidatus Melainabacteria bacterium RIFCSPHIGHO2_02_FULL_34_12]|nr:MAG: hypothetical protein A3B68_02245 [Candidatus Melainabacteria bacterium RIFCSPHIGHO2_02_FULL_34_12]